MEISVAIQTYNHQNFIEQSVLSALEQIIPHDITWEIVILDDYSTDDTRLKLLRLSRNNPRIRLLLNDENLGVNKSYLKLIQNCVGIYVAYLDGDDYWIDPYKLHNQLVLVQNSGSVFCCGKSIIKNKDPQVIDYINGPKDKKVDREYFLRGGYLQTSTYFMDRNKLLVEIERMVHASFCITDVVPRYLLTKSNKIVFYDEYCSVYRIWNGGYWSSKDLITRELEFLNFWSTITLVEKSGFYLKKYQQQIKKLLKSKDLSNVKKLNICFKYCENLIILWIR